MRIPPIYETFPSWFIPQETISKARQDVSMMEITETKVRIKYINTIAV